MAQRGDELNTRLTATDDASKVVDKVADKVADLEDSEHDVELDADAGQAEQEIGNLDRRLDDLTREERVAVLEVKADKAKRELADIARRLANAEKYDDEEIRLIIEARDNATSRLQSIRSELKDLQDEADDTGNSLRSRIGDALSSLDDRFGGIGAKLGGKLAAGFASVGAGALMVQALEQSWNQAGGLRRITGQFRLSAEEAGEYGRVAGELWADNWGESLPEVQQVVALAGQRLEDVTNRSLGNISKQILSVAQTWGADYEAVIRSVTQLTQNGLARSTQEALDLIVTGFQDGADEAGDFLDTIDEYSQHWAAMGLSGQDALNIIIAGFQNGQRDADKLADAIKEFRIRAVEDTDTISAAYERLGLDADRTREKFIAGGPAAREAYLEVLGALASVKDPIEQNRLAIELIGTQFEDLGPTAITALTSVRGQLRETEGAAKDLSDTVQATPWEQLRRDAEGWLLNLGNGLGRLANADFGAGFGQGIDEARERLEGGTRQTTAVVENAARIIRDRWGAAGDAIRSALDAASGDATDLGTAGRDAAQIVQEEIDDAAERVRRFGSDGVENMNQVSDAAAGTADALAGVGEELGRLLGQLSEEQAVNSLADQWDRVLEAQAEYYTAEKNGSEGATKAQREYRDELIKMALDVGRFAQQVGDIPQERLVRLATAIENDSIAEIERALDDIFRDRTIRLDVSGTGPTRFRRTDDGGWERVDDGATAASVTTQQPQQGNTYVYSIAPTPSQTSANQRELTFTGGYRPR